MMTPDQELGDSSSARFYGGGPVRCPTPEVVTIGEVLGLLLAANSPLDEATKLIRSYAGAESNVAVGLARLGHRVTWFGRVGSDTFGRTAIRSMMGEGVNVSHVAIDVDKPTGLILRDATNDRPITVEYYRADSAGAALSVDDVDLSTVSRARVLHITGITPMLSKTARAAVLAAIESAQEGGTTIMLDPNVRLKLATWSEWRSVMEILTAEANIVLVGANEAALMKIEDIAQWFLERGADRVVVKDGPKGAWETDGDVLITAAARSVREVDPVGAGDAFAAGWISGWLLGLDPTDRLRRATVVASCVVASLGDTSGLPHMTTLETILGSGDELRR